MNTFIANNLDIKTLNTNGKLKITIYDAGLNARPLHDKLQHEIVVGHIDIYISAHDFMNGVYAQTKEYLDDEEEKYTLNSYISNVRDDNTAHLDTMYINPDYRGKRLAQALILEALLVVNKEYIVLQDVSNIPQYYEKMGFKRIFDNENTNLMIGHTDVIVKNLRHVIGGNTIAHSLYDKLSQGNNYTVIPRYEDIIKLIIILILICVVIYFIAITIKNIIEYNIIKYTEIKV